MELHRDPDARPGTTAVLAVDGHDVVAAMQVRDDAGGVVALDVEAPGARGPRRGPGAASAAALPLTERPGSEPRALMVSDALVRHEARRLGWTGALRGLLSPPLARTDRRRARAVGRGRGSRRSFPAATCASAGRCSARPTCGSPLPAAGAGVRVRLPA